MPTYEYSCKVCAKKCGREPGGSKCHDGRLPGDTRPELDGAHGGKNAGERLLGRRRQPAAAGQGTFAKKFESCEKCDFYLRCATRRADFTFSSVAARRSGLTPPPRRAAGGR